MVQIKLDPIFLAAAGISALFFVGCGKEASGGGGGGGGETNPDDVGSTKCKDIVESAEAKDIGKGNKCTRCVIGRLDNSFEGAELINNWQKQAKRGDFKKNPEKIKSGGQEYCVAVVEKANQRIAKENNAVFQEMMTASTDCGGDLEDWTKRPSDLCDKILDDLENNPDAADGLFMFFNPYFDLGITGLE